MIVTIHTVLVLSAFACFCLAAFGVPARVNWVGLGLALWVLAGLLR
jgi:hypothetical protein